jgi:hypothetical protein
MAFHGSQEHFLHFREVNAHGTSLLWPFLI